MSLVSLGELQQLVSAHGYWAVALIVGLESMGLPLGPPVTIKTSPNVALRARMLVRRLAIGTTLIVSLRRTLCQLGAS